MVATMLLLVLGGAGLIGLCMLAAGALMLLRDAREHKWSVVGIILLVLGLVLTCALMVVGFAFFFLPMRMY